MRRQRVSRCLFALLCYTTILLLAQIRHIVITTALCPFDDIRVEKRGGRATRSTRSVVCNSLTLTAKIICFLVACVIVLPSVSAT